MKPSESARAYLAPVCVKCGADEEADVEITYQPTPTGTDTPPEYMKCKCNRCGHSWSEKPLDVLAREAKDAEHAAQKKHR